MSTHNCSISRAEDALHHIDPSLERDQWSKIAMALKSEFGADGIDLFDTWSEPAKSYDFNDLYSTWNSVSEDGGIGIGTLFHIAKEHGYKPSGRALTADERRAFALEVEVRKAKRNEEKARLAACEERRHEHAAEGARSLWERCEELEADVEYPYLKSKGLDTFGTFGTGVIRHFGNDLLIPMVDAKGVIWNVERIFQNGDKRGVFQGKRKGLCSYLEGKGAYVITEGWATAMSIFQATGMNVICAFGKNNLLAIAQMVRGNLPDVKIIIAGDVASEDAALNAAIAVDGNSAFPPLVADGSDFNDLHTLMGLGAVKTIIKAASPANGWPEIIPLDTALPEVMKFNPDMMPDGLSTWVEDIAERMQCPADFVGTSAMWTASVLLGRKIGIHPQEKGDWLVVPNLWGACCGVPSTKKTPGITAATAPLRRFAAESRKEFGKGLREHGFDEMAYEVKFKEIENNLKAAIKAGDTAAETQIKLDAMAMEEPAGPVQKRYSVNDATVEKLGELLNESGNGLGLLRDELTGWLKGLDKENHSNDRSFYLEAFNGTGSYTYDRIGRGTIHIEHNLVSVFGGIQPAKLRPYVTNAVNQNSDDDGLIQRMQLLVYPDHGGAWQKVNKSPDAAAERTAIAIFEKLRDATQEVDEDYGGILGVQFTSKAQILFDSWYEMNENRIRRDDIHPAIAAHFGKYGSFVATLALIINEIDVGHAKQVTKRSVSKALMWIEYLETHAMRVYGDVASPVMHCAELIFKRRASLPDGFTSRDVARKHWSGLSKREHIDAALDELAECGYLKYRSESVGGRPTSRFTWNPNI